MTYVKMNNKFWETEKMTKIACWLGLSLLSFSPIYNQAISTLCEHFCAQNLSDQLSFFDFLSLHLNARKMQGHCVFLSWLQEEHSANQLTFPPSHCMSTHCLSMVDAALYFWKSLLLNMFNILSQVTEVSIILWECCHDRKQLLNWPQAKLKLLF